MIRQTAAKRAGAKITLACGHRVGSDPAASNGAGSSEVDCGQCDERVMPDGLESVRTTPEFDADSVPNALLNDHHTTAWAQLTVLAGEVRFIEQGSGFVATVNPDAALVIVPHRYHRVEPSPGARFSVEFFKASGPP